MKVTLVADEFFSWGVYGGFGAFTRKLAHELMKNNVEVEVVVHHVSDLQKAPGETEFIDGVPVMTLPRKKLAKIRQKHLYKSDADIIHSQCGMYDTYLMFLRNKEPKKAVTIQDLRTKAENKLLAPLEKTSGYPWYKQLWAMYVRSCYVRAMKSADAVACHARFLIPKIKQVYGVSTDVVLPNFIDVPAHNFRKADQPCVVWLGRLDPIKQPERCFEVAKESPHVQFYVLGASHKPYGGQLRDEYFKKKYGTVKNLHFMGFQSGEVKEQLLSKAWVLINTSAYECLPVSFLEALAHKCALLSTQNPDNYTAHFGVWSAPNRLKHSLDRLLKDEFWRLCGEKGYNHVKNVHSTEKGIDVHLQLYKNLLK